MMIAIYKSPQNEIQITIFEGQYGRSEGVLVRISEIENSEVISFPIA